MLQHYKKENSSIKESKGFSAFSYITTSGIQIKSKSERINILLIFPKSSGFQVSSNKKNSLMGYQLHGSVQNNLKIRDNEIIPSIVLT